MTKAARVAQSERKLRTKAFLWRWSVGFSLGLKRLTDVLGSLLACLLLAPLAVLIVVLIKYEDGGPILYRQLRVGHFGRPFVMFKIRSMCINAESQRGDLQDQSHHAHSGTFKIKDDPRITRVGRYLRQFSLDEAPQFYNVLRGDMSLVGPRPALVDEMSNYSANALRRLVVRPGITGLWQVNGRGDIDFRGQVRLDLRYIRSESLWENARILLLTIPAVLLGRGAY